MTKLSSLFWAFARIGGLTFGGGYAMLPMLEREVVEKHHWSTQEELLNYFAIGQCTPGLIAVNTATFIGYTERGILGGIVSTLGIVAPSLIVILAIAMVLTNFAHVPVVQHAFAGIRVAVSALIVNTVIKLIKTNIKDLGGILVCLAAFVLVAVFGASPVFIVIGAGLYGIIRGGLSRRNKQ